MLRMLLSFWIVVIDNSFRDWGWGEGGAIAWGGGGGGGGGQGHIKTHIKTHIYTHSHLLSVYKYTHACNTIT